MGTASPMRPPSVSVSPCSAKATTSFIPTCRSATIRQGDASSALVLSGPKRRALLQTLRPILVSPNEPRKRAVLTLTITHQLIRMISVWDMHRNEKGYGRKEEKKESSGRQPIRRGTLTGPRESERH